VEQLRIGEGSSVVSLAGGTEGIVFDHARDSSPWRRGGRITIFPPGLSPVQRIRTDIRGSRIPQMSIDDQRLYGTAFRTLDEFERRVRELVELSDRATALARDGLTGGALHPPHRPVRGRGVSPPTCPAPARAAVNGPEAFTGSSRRGKVSRRKFAHTSDDGGHHGIRTCSGEVVALLQVGDQSRTSRLPPEQVASDLC
ncbi:hypothetical protein ABZ260_26265, partial [Streptosporangium sp. NPDC006013]